MQLDANLVIEEALDSASLPQSVGPAIAYFAQDPAFQVLVAPADRAPTLGMLRQLQAARQGQKAISVVVAVEHSNQVSILDADGEKVADVSAEQAQRALQEALDEDDELLARDRLRGLLSSYVAPEGGADPLFGVSNKGLFARHFLEKRVPERDDWERAQLTGQSARSLRGLDLIDGLGFDRSEGPNGTQLLSGKSPATRAVAVLLAQGETWDAPSARFELSPVAFALREATFREAPWVIATQGSRLRLYSGKPGVGVGQQGQADTFFEIDLAAVSDEQVGLLALVFSPEALSPGGSVEEILEGSTRYATGLGDRLRERIYSDVVPALAVNIAEQLPTLGMELDEEGLQQAYSASLHVLFRLLFQAYAEDRGLLPAGRNDHYDERSLVRFMTQEQDTPPEDFAESSSSIWHRMMQVWDVIEHGDSQWQVPPYSGGLFSDDADTNPTGALLSRLRVPNSVLGPALQGLLLDTGEDGTFGPVDFRALSVRQFGTIYEGLLESSLSLAPEDLTVNDKGRWVPTTGEDAPDTQTGEPYFHTASGERKATGSYFTPELVVDLLVERSVRPGVEKHLRHILALLETGKPNQAAQDFFDFRVADLAMGSGHFLTAAVDEIETRMRDFLTEHPIPGVQNELLRLAEVASEALGDDAVAKSEVEDVALLRRQIARRCIYGIDSNPLATELARLALWIHTFVPGLPLSGFDHNLVTADSLTGVGSVEEALSVLLPGRAEGAPTLLDEFIERPLGQAEELFAKAAAVGEADRSEALRARELLAHAATAVEPVERLFDAVVAARTGAVKIPQMLVTASEIDAFARQPEVSEMAARFAPAHFPALFPEVFTRENPGFDVLIGNPPWEEVMVEEPKFWLKVRPGLLGLSPSALKKEVKQLRRDRSDLLPELEKSIKAADETRELLLAGPYPDLGKGDVDLYRVFAWRNWQLLREGGAMGLVVPRALLQAGGSEQWRREVLSSGRADITALINSRHWVFPIHPQYSIALVTTHKDGELLDAPLLFSGPFHSEEEFLEGKEDASTFVFSDVEAASSTASIPNLPKTFSGEVFRQMRQAPRLDHKRAGWDFRPVREFDATNDRPTFDAGEGIGTVPVLRGRAFDIWEPETGDVYAWGDPDKIEQELIRKRKNQIRHSKSAFHGLGAEWAADASTLPLRRVRLAVRDVTNATNSRTVLAALVPPEHALNNTAPYLFRRQGDARAEAFLLGVLSSIPLDWYARRFVELHLNFHILNALPIPLYNQSAPLAQRVVEISGRLAAVDGRYSEWAAEVGVPVGSVKTEAEKEALIYELDALVALLYGLDRQHLSHVFETFHRGWDYEPRLAQVLSHYDRWEEAK